MHGKHGKHMRYGYGAPVYYGHGKHGKFKQAKIKFKMGKFGKFKHGKHGKFKHGKRGGWSSGYSS